jgi:hypothetical protein
MSDTTIAAVISAIKILAPRRWPIRPLSLEKLSPVPSRRIMIGDAEATSSYWHERLPGVFNISKQNEMGARSSMVRARSTVFRAIKAGRISAQRDDNGQWQIDPAEFHRVFSPPTPATSSQPTMQHGAMTDALVTTLNKVIDDLRADRDHWACSL